MNLVKSSLVAGGVTLALILGVAAQGGGEPWDVKERMAYVVMMDGSMKQIKLGDKGVAMLMKSAKKLAPGTVLMMSGKDLYMVNDATMFDKAGMPTFGGS